MAKNESTRVRPIVLSADRESLDALRTLTDYSPANPAFSLDAITAAKAALDNAQTAETQAASAYATARDHATAAEWNFHNLILGMKDQVVAQYGRDSTQVQAIGLTRASERKSPGRRTPTE